MYIKWYKFILSINQKNILITIFRIVHTNWEKFSIFHIQGVLEFGTGLTSSISIKNLIKIKLHIPIIENAMLIIWYA